MFEMYRGANYGRFHKYVRQFADGQKQEFKFIFLSTNVRLFVPAWCKRNGR